MGETPIMAPSYTPSGKNKTCGSHKVKSFGSWFSAARGCLGF